MILRIHHKHWNSKMKRRELRYIWTKINIPFTYIDFDQGINYSPSLSSKVMDLIAKYLGGKL